MHKLSGLICVMFIALASCATATLDDSSDAEEIKAVLSKQQEAWNRGDIPSFMEGYWKSDELRFASGGNITKGWQATLDRYLKSYDGDGKMGELSFSNLEVEVTGPTDGLVFGKWELKREDDRPWGFFTLHFEKIAGDWLIVSDHTSSGGS